MPVEVRMPELASDMTEADLLSWLVKPGDSVRAGDLIAEIETDKSTVEFESPVSGTLLEILVPGGTDGVAVGTVLALFEGDADAASPAPPEEPQGAAPEPESKPAPEPAARAAAQPEPAPVAAPTAKSASGASATALARRVAGQTGVDLDAVAGTGPGGRITKSDVQAAKPARPAQPEKPAQPQATGASADKAETPPSSFQSDTPFRIEPLSRMRRTIATRLQQSKQTIPHFYLHVDCAIDRLLDLRKKLNAEGRRISVNDFIVRASALALIEVPGANVSYSDEGLVYYERADVAVAVATDGGLVTPLVREADRKELEQLSDEIRDLATRAREGKLTPREYQGGSFTVSNLGMFGVDSVYPIVNPPQSCILGVGAGTEQPVVRDGKVAVGHQMTLTLSADHRAVDGAVGAQLLAAIKRRVEDPLEMLL